MTLIISVIANHFDIMRLIMGKGVLSYDFCKNVCQRLILFPT